MIILITIITIIMIIITVDYNKWGCDYQLTNYMFKGRNTETQ